MHPYVFTGRVFTLCQLMRKTFRTLLKIDYRDTQTCYKTAVAKGKHSLAHLHIVARRCPTPHCRP